MNRAAIIGIVGIFAIMGYGIYTNKVYLPQKAEAREWRPNFPPVIYNPENGKYYHMIYNFKDKEHCFQLKRATNEELKELKRIHDESVRAGR
jgi:hypothetical protein